MQIQLYFSIQLTCLFKKKIPLIASKTKHVIKKSTTDVTVTLKVFINKPIRNILLFAFNWSAYSFFVYCSMIILLQSVNLMLC